MRAIVKGGKNENYSDGSLPVWVRVPRRGQARFYSGCNQAKKLWDWGARLKEGLHLIRVQVQEP